MMNATVLLIIFCLIFNLSSLKLFKFKKIKDNSLELASVTSKNDLNFNEMNDIIICSSHKQNQLNTENTHAIYVLYKDNSFQKPWFSIGFWNKVML